MLNMVEVLKNVAPVENDGFDDGLLATVENFFHGDPVFVNISFFEIFVLDDERESGDLDEADEENLWISFLERNLENSFVSGLGRCRCPFYESAFDGVIFSK